MLFYSSWRDLCSLKMAPTMQPALFRTTEVHLYLLCVYIWALNIQTGSDSGSNRSSGPSRRCRRCAIVTAVLLCLGALGTVVGIAVYFSGTYVLIKRWTANTQRRGIYIYFIIHKRTVKEAYKSSYFQFLMIVFTPTKNFIKAFRRS